MKGTLAATADDGPPHELQNYALKSPDVPPDSLNNGANDDPPAKRQRLTNQAIADTIEPDMSHKDTGKDAASSSNSGGLPRLHR